MSPCYGLLYVFVVTGLQCLYNVDTLNSADNEIIGDTSKHSVCITDKYDIISSYYHQIIYDPRMDIIDNRYLLTCKNRTIWISEDSKNSKYVIYYQLFNDLLNGLNIGGFGIFECSSDSYLTALKSQSVDKKSNNLCIDPISIYPDSYPGSQCKGKPIIYCLPFKDSTKCPQFQMTMNSMYNSIDFSSDLIEMNNFFECNCWFKANDEGNMNNDERINIDINFNENCIKIQKEKKLKENKEEKELLSYGKNQKNQRQQTQEKEYKNDIELEKNREFNILWASLGFIIGCIVLIIIVIYSCRKQYDKKMYLFSRNYRKAHIGERENDNLINGDNNSESESDTENDTDNDIESNDTHHTDLSTELAFA